MGRHRPVYLLHEYPDGQLPSGSQAVSSSWHVPPQQTPKGGMSMAPLVVQSAESLPGMGAQVARSIVWQVSVVTQAPAQQK